MVKRNVLATILAFGLVLLQGCAAVQAFRARDTVRVVRDIPYLAGSDNPKHRLDLFLPEGRTGFPVVHFIHGGYWRDGDRRYYAPITGLYSNIGIALAREGIGVVVQSYRILPEARIEAQISDVADAVRWTVGHIRDFGGDPGRLVLAGHSAGGHLAPLIGVDPARVTQAGLDPQQIRGFVSLSGILDLTQMVSMQTPERREEITWPVFGRDEAALRRYSPVSYLRPGLPPFLIMRGEKDFPTVNAQSGPIVDRLKADGNDVTYLVLPGLVHADLVLKIGRRGDPVSGPIVSFVRRVTGNPAEPSGEPAPAR